MQYKRLTLQQVEAVRGRFGGLASRTCDYTVGGMFMWREFYRAEYAEENGILFTRLTSHLGHTYYNLPLAEDMESALQMLMEDVRRNGHENLRFCTVPEEYLSLVSALFDEPLVTEQTDFSDYLYNASDLCTLAGKKFSGQRNQVSQFHRNVESWSFSPIDEGNLSRVVAYFTEGCPLSPNASESAREENRMVGDVLGNFSAYGMFGGVLEANGEIVGFSLGETVGDTLYTHIERASRSCKGAYQMLVNQFALMYADGKVSFINREEDMGDIGLRTAKEAYHPICLLKKYMVEGKIK